MGRTIQMKICATGCASNGIRQVADIKKAIEDLLEDGELQNHHLLDDFENADLGMAHIAISCLHDGLMAIVRGELTVDGAKDFFFGGKVPDAKDYFDDIIKLKSTESPTDAK